MSRAPPAEEQFTISNHPYKDALTAAPSSFYHYDDLEIAWGSPEPYELHRKIGRGKYSEVFTATNMQNGFPCVVKVLKPVKEKKFKRELLILTHLSGIPNVITLYDMIRDPETNTPAFVFERVNNRDFRSLYPSFTELDIKFYMYELIRTLDVCHAMGIFHRDVKPQNLCIDHDKKKIRLIDWGLAEFYLHNVPLNVRVASRYYKGPELLLGYRKYDYALDIWSVGCVLAAMLFGMDTLFVGSDNEDQLVQITRVLGTAELGAYCQKLGLGIPGYAQSPVYPKRPWNTLVPRSRVAFASPNALDLIERMLRMDHTQRLTAAECLAHPFFDDVRPRDAAGSSTVAAVHPSMR